MRTIPGGSKHTCCTILLILFFAGSSFTCVRGDSSYKHISEHVSVYQGDVNGVLIKRNGRKSIVYGDPSGQVMNADFVLFPHNRRELISAGRKLVEHGAKAVIPIAEADRVEQPESFWSTLLEKRSSYFGGRFTNRAVEPLPVAKTVRAGETLSWQGLDVRVLETPGYDENAISYIARVDQKTYAFTGDLIYDRGQIADIYNLQSAVEGTEIGRYHGYMGRIGELLRSLQKMKAEDPDVIVPSRGNVIRNPDEAIDLLIKRLQKVYKTYLAVSSVRWYFGDDLDTLASDAQIQTSDVDTSFSAEKTMEDLPPWIIPIGNSRLIVSQNGSGFLSDCGSDNVIKKVEQLIEKGKIQSLEGVFITHYHGDHVNRINKLVKRFDCDVYANEEQREILEHPNHVQMPYAGVRPIDDITYVKNGYEMEWQEFRMKFYYFPGQTIYHGSMWLDKKNEDTDLFFIGDSFSPTGMDDYSLQNRNLLHRNIGYYRCLKILKRMNKKKTPYYLINQHIRPAFWFSNEQIDVLIDNLDRRRALFNELFPWENVNFGIDPQWARFDPYQLKKTPGEQFDITLRMFNHYETSTAFQVNLSLPDGFSLQSGDPSVDAGPLEQHQHTFTLRTSEDIEPGLYVIPAIVKNAGNDLAIHIESLVEIPGDH